jgi:hypothetical protein
MEAVNALDILGNWSDRGSRSLLGTESEEDVLRRMAEHEEAAMKECMRLQDLLTACVRVLLCIYACIDLVTKRVCVCLHVCVRMRVCCLCVCVYEHAHNSYALCVYQSTYAAYGLYM